MNRKFSVYVFTKRSRDHIATFYCHSKKEAEELCEAIKKDVKTAYGRVQGEYEITVHVSDDNRIQ